jgi:hypothetical protein
MAVKNSEDSNDSAGDFQKGFAQKLPSSSRITPESAIPVSTAGMGTPSTPKTPPTAVTSGKTTAKIQIAGAPKNAPHNPTAHGDHMIQSSQWMRKTTKKSSNGTPPVRAFAVAADRASSRRRRIEVADRESLVFCRFFYCESALALTGSRTIAYGRLERPSRHVCAPRLNEMIKRMRGREHPQVARAGRSGSRRRRQSDRCPRSPGKFREEHFSALRCCETFFSEIVS